MGLVSGNDPDNVAIDDTAYVETTFSFLLYRSERAGGRARSATAPRTYLGTMFDVGPQGRVTSATTPWCTARGSSATRRSRSATTR